MCRECTGLLAAAHTATLNHIRLLSKLQITKLTRNHDEVAALPASLAEAIAFSQHAILRYQQHCGGHNDKLPVWLHSLM